MLQPIRAPTKGGRDLLMGDAREYRIGRRPVKVDHEQIASINPEPEGLAAARLPFPYPFGLSQTGVEPVPARRSRPFAGRSPPAPARSPMAQRLPPERVGDRQVEHPSKGHPRRWAGRMRSGANRPRPQLIRFRRIRSRFTSRHRASMLNRIRALRPTIP